MKINSLNISEVFNKNFKWVKIFIMAAAYGYLIYSFATFRYYDDLLDFFQTSAIKNIKYLFLTIILIPFNWFLEIIKWKEVLKRIQEISLIQATKSVLIGLTSGFFTPNRVGEPVGRAMMLEDGNKTKGVICSLICTLSQTFATLFFVMLSLLGVAQYFPGEDVSIIRNLALVGIVVISFLYFTLPFWIGKIKSNSQKIKNIIEGISLITYSRLLKISLYSIIRFGIYTFQYYLMLKFFSIDIDLVLAFIAIPINYFLVSITPSISFSEIGIRGSYAILILGVFTNNTVAVALSGISLWILNYVLPMLLGSYFLAKSQK